MSRATRSNFPSNARSLSVASASRGTTLFGTISTCTGACGLTSWNAIASSSSQMILAGIWRAVIFSKMVMTIQYSENLGAQITNLGPGFEDTLVFGVIGEVSVTACLTYCCKSQFNALNNRDT